MIPSDALRSAIEGSYEAFAREPRPTGWRAAPHRDGDALLLQLTAVPLADLKDEAIGPYSSWAITTVGSAQDYKYFLPRILALAVSDTGSVGADPPVIAGRLKMSQWESWPAAQRDAVLNLFETAFLSALESQGQGWMDIENWLCGLARLDRPLEPFLLAWAQAMSAEAGLQLSRFVQGNAKRLARGDSIASGFWEDVDISVRQQVSAWLLSEQVRHRLEVALERVAEEDRWEIEQGLFDLDRAH
ncbi:MAG: hypothetical protein ABI810_08615 [Sphingomonas bacterium]